MDKKEAFGKLIEIRSFLSKDEMNKIFEFILKNLILANGDEKSCDFEETCINDVIPLRNLSYWSLSQEEKNLLQEKIVDLFIPLIKKIYGVYYDTGFVLIQRLLESQEWRTLPNEYTE